MLLTLFLDTVPESFKFFWLYFWIPYRNLSNTFGFIFGYRTGTFQILLALFLDTVPESLKCFLAQRL
jgi:hypothetical protein